MQHNKYSTNYAAQCGTTNPYILFYNNCVCSHAYLFTASSKSISMFLWTCNKVRLLSLFFPIVVLKKGLSRRRAENVRSASQNVAGIALIILNRVEMLGNSLLSHLLRASIGLSGTSVLTGIHLCFQQCGSVCSERGAGKSSW